jgi:hypothetical protein
MIQKNAEFERTGFGDRLAFGGAKLGATKSTALKRMFRIVHPRLTYASLPIRNEPSSHIVTQSCETKA